MYIYRYICVIMIDKKKKLLIWELGEIKSGWREDIEIFGGGSVGSGIVFF